MRQVIRSLLQYVRPGTVYWTRPLRFTFEGLDPILGFPASRYPALA